MVIINGQAFGDKFFPNGEIVYEDVELHSQNTIQLYYDSDIDIMRVLMGVEYIRDEMPNSTISLYIMYLPYSAMDRKINNQVFSLKLIASIINKLRLDEVYLFDPHNVEVTLDLINKAKLMDINEIVQKAIASFNPDIIYFPDKGAKAKYPSLIDTNGLPVIYGNKVRDLNNKGKIVAYETITNGVDISGKRVLIIDDICRKGGTFVWAAQELTKLGVKDIGLYVSHCETGIFEGKVLSADSPISKVYTTITELGILEFINNSVYYEQAKKIEILRFKHT